MLMIYVIILGIIITTGKCKKDELNEVTSQPGILDTSLRKALLKALTELENEDKNFLNGNLKDSDNKAIEKAKASAVSFYKKSPTISTTTESDREKEIVVIQKSNGLQHKPITTYEALPGNFTNSDQFLVSASSRNIPENNYNTRKNTSRFKSLATNSIVFNNKSVTPKSDVTSPSPTIASPTTEESQAKVEDVQFFSAPLVAAFTVHQDALGLPKSVEPIYKQSVRVPITTKNFKEHKTEEETYKQQLLKREHIRNQIALQERQRALEEHLYRIQQQQKQQQEFLIKQQELLHEQQKRFLEERIRLQRNEQPFAPVINPNQHHVPTQQLYNTISEQSNIHLNTEEQFSVPPIIHPHQQNKGALVSFQSSVSLNPIEQFSNELPANVQHLPIKNSVDFRQSPYVSTYNRVQSVLTPPQNSFHHTNYAQNIDVPPVTHHGNRIYRREPATGNYVNNDYQHNRPLYYNNVSIHPSVKLTNAKFLRSNLENYQTSPRFPVQQPTINQHLNNLLYTSGISQGKESDDLNIVSKVLSYNHLGGENFFYTPKLYHTINRIDKKV